MQLNPTDDLIVEGPLGVLSLPGEQGKHDGILALDARDCRIMHEPSEPLLKGEIVEIRIRRLHPQAQRDVNDGRVT